MSHTLTERQALIVLNALPGIGPVTLHRLLDAAGGDPRAVLGAPPGRFRGIDGLRAGAAAAVERWEEHFDLAREEGRISRSGADVLIAADPAYPALLRRIADPPAVLYRKGRYDMGGRCVAIVGSRKATLYGRGVARRLAGELAGRGFCIVSGLARGIDTAAHEGALEAGGRTAAVLGTGIDLVYPPENLDLYRRIAAEGALLSEFPFGSQADKHTFPMRNRVVSGMCEAVVVVESDVHGGAMITARFAGEQGRLLFAVPGRIDQPTSAGCNQLIRDGATLVTRVEDILDEIRYQDGRPGKVEAAGAAGDGAGDAQALPGAGGGPGDAGKGAGGGPLLSGDEAAVMECFRGGGAETLDSLAQNTAIGASRVAAAVTRLEVGGRVVLRADGRYEASPGA